MYSPQWAASPAASCNAMLAKRLCVAVLGFLGLAFSGGCGREASKLVPVEGTVTLDGQPLARVQVMFDRPELSPNENKPYTGMTDDEGRYSIRALMDNRAGAPPGHYRVSLTTAVAEPPYREDARLPPERIPPQYRQGKLELNVPDGGAKDANFSLKSK
jgi:hypothetical protein